MEARNRSLQYFGIMCSMALGNLPHIQLQTHTTRSEEGAQDREKGHWFPVTQQHKGDMFSPDANNLHTPSLLIIIPPAPVMVP